MSTEIHIKKLPVFIVSGKSPMKSFGGGYSTFSLNLAKVLSDIGHPVYIVSIGEKNEIVHTTYGTFLVCKSFFLDYYTTALPSLPFTSYIFAKAIKKIMSEEKIDKAIVWGIGPWGLGGSLLKKYMKQNIIFVNNYFTSIKHEWKGAVNAVTVADYGLFMKIKVLCIYYTIVQILSVFEKIVLSSTELIVTNYRSTEEILKKEFHISEKKFVRTTFLVQVYQREAKEVRHVQIKNLPKKYLLYMSRHDPRKGINYLLHAMVILVKEKKAIPLVIGGTGEMFEANKALAKRLGLEKWVLFTGFVNNAEILLKRATVFCFPTVEEGAGALIINEVMSLGLPIVSTSCDGIVEDIEHNKSGLLVPMGDPEALALAIWTLLDNPSLAKELGKNAKKQYMKKFSFEMMRNDVKKILDHLTKNRY